MQIHVENKALNLQTEQKTLCETGVFFSIIYGLIQEHPGDTSGL